MASFPKAIPLAERFFKYVDMSAGPDHCWPWIGMTKTSKGGAKRGRIRADFPSRKWLLAHRVALALSTDAVIPGAEVECAHSCDNPICVNPRHLEWKSHKDNMADYIAKFGKIAARRFGKTTPLLDVEAKS